MIRRLLLRTLVLAAITLVAFGQMESMTILTGWPEVMQGLGAAAKLAWAEMTVLWLRLAISPKQDAQRLAMLVEDRHGAAPAQAVLFCAYTAAWALRLVAFLWLMEH